MIRGLLLFLSLALAMSAQATITVTPRGTVTHNTSSSSFAITFPQAMSAGSTGALCVAIDNPANGGTNLAASVTDSAGNVWVRAADRTNAVSAGLGSEEAMYIATYLSFPITTSPSTTVTVTWTGNSTAKTAAIWELTASAGNWIQGPINSSGAVFTSAAPTFTTLNAISNGHAVLAMAGIENHDQWSDDTGSTNGTWSTSQHTGVGSTTTGMSIISQYKIVTGTATQTYTPGYAGASSDGAIVTWTFTEVGGKVRYVGSTPTGSAVASDSMSVRVPLTAGSLAVLCVAADNAGGASAALPTGTGITDTGFNIWTRQQTRNNGGTANAQVEVAIYTSLLTTTLASGDTITMTYITSIAAKSWVLYEFAPLVSGSAMSVPSGGVSGSLATATPSITTGSSITSGDTVVAMGGVEAGDSWGAATNASNGSWSFHNHIGYTNSTSGVSVSSQYKPVTATATQTYDPTLTGTPDSALAWISLHDSSPTTSPSAFLQFFP